jgi:hypothetical protein
MKFEDFLAGVWTPRYQYQSFEPSLTDLPAEASAN